jgi:hypothetical protein
VRKWGTKRTLNIGHANVRSLNSNFVDFTQFVKEVDIMGVSETWLNPDYSSNFVNICGYTLVRNDRDGRGGGVALYIANSIKYKLYETASLLNGLEQLWIIVILKSSKLAIGIIYKPPSASLRCLKELADVLDHVCVSYDSVLFLGDVNINFLNAKAANVTFFTDLLNTYNLTQLVTAPTRVTRNSESLIDIVCVSSDLRCVQCVNKDMNGISDHMLIVCEVEVEYQLPVNSFFHFRDFSLFNDEDFALDAMNACWKSVDNEVCLDEKLNKFNDIIITLFNKHAPIKQCNLKNKNRMPYVTYNIKQMIKTKNKAHSRYLKTRQTSHKKYYIELKDYVKEAIAREKTAYFKYMIQKNKNNAKKTMAKLG